MLILAILGWNYRGLVFYIMFEFLISFLQSEKVTLVSFREIKFLLRLIWHGIARNLPYLLFIFVIPCGLLFCD